MHVHAPPCKQTISLSIYLSLCRSFLNTNRLWYLTTPERQRKRLTKLVLAQLASCAAVVFCYRLPKYTNGQADVPGLLSSRRRYFRNDRRIPRYNVYTSSISRWGQCGVQTNFLLSTFPEISPSPKYEVCSNPSEKSARLFSQRKPQMRAQHNQPLSEWLAMKGLQQQRRP